MGTDAVSQTRSGKGKKFSDLGRKPKGQDIAVASASASASASHGTGTAGTMGTDAVSQTRSGKGGCVSALAAVWVVPCAGGQSADAVAAVAKDVNVGDCILDGDGTVSQVYFKNLNRKSADEMLEVELEPSGRNLGPGQRVAVNLTANHLVPNAQGRLVPARYLHPGLAAGDGVVKKLTVHPERS